MLDQVRYVPALDGLRAVAILGVLAFHALPGTLNGGFTGVDVFFVLSGYLITSTILHDMRGGTFTLREFYLRRIQRLLPNVILTVLCTVVVSFFVRLPSNAVADAQHGLWTIFNLSNIYIWRHLGGYWGESAASAPLLHTWSLAVEEQFYLVFPAVLLLAGRSKRSITILLALGSLAISIYSFPTFAFYLLPARAWEPLAGATLALVPIALDTRAKAVVGWLGLIAIVGAFFFIAEPGVVVLVPVVGALAVLASIADGRGMLASLLSRPVLVTIGKLSYSLYLWHWPLAVIAREHAFLRGESQQTWGLIGTAAGIVLAVIAYVIVEQPLRRRGAGRSQRLRIIATGFALCLALCVTMSMHRPLADPAGRFDRLAFYGNLYSVGPPPRIDLSTSTRYSDVLIPPDVQRASEIWTTGGIVHNWGGGTPRVVVLGSSHATMYGRAIDDICQQLHIPVAFLSADGAPVFFPSLVGEDTFPTRALAQSFDDARRKWIAAWHPDAVLVIDRWDFRAGPYGDLDRKLRELVDALTPHTRTVIVVSQIPALRIGETVNLREYLTCYVRKTGRLPTIAPDALEPNRRSSIATIEAIARDYPKVQFLRVDQPFYLDDGSVRYSTGRHFLYADDDHLSAAGTEFARDIFTSAIAAATRVR